MKKIRTFNFKIHNDSDKYYSQIEYLETEYFGIKKVIKYDEKGFSTCIGEYNHESIIVELPEGELFTYLIDYKGYEIIFATPITTGHCSTWKGTGENNIRTKIYYTLKKPN